MLVILLCLPVSAQDKPPTGGQPWDLKYVAQTGQFVFYDSPAGASTTGKPLDIGDFDNNGCGDVAITGQNATHALGTWRGSAGHLRIFMNACPIGGKISMDDVSTQGRIFSIYGAYSGDMAGSETYVADFNDDGYDDLLFSAQNSDGPDQTRSNAGAVYLLFGGGTFAGHTD
ncbi:MAG TPA: hypothetical protein VHO69_05500, partial [Phototrophicaceae bacterium]|nr:hypothetical protein [Phototrophicaceae bacterium]